jgi:predicted amidohydrolase YtcJ
LADSLAAFHDAGLLVHCHTNGDEALDVFLDAVAEVQRRNPRPDHRHTAQHAQLTTPAQFKRMAELGVNANLFTNHIWYWGDQHRTLTVGKDRAAGMNACRSALNAGVTLAFHSDAPITPIGPLHTMWCAVNRITSSGKVLGPDERLTSTEALQAATLGAAYQLRMADEVGSIPPGKRADFSVLEEDPLAVEPMALRNIKVWGTVLSGVVHRADTSPNPVD